MTSTLKDSPRFISPIDDLIHVGEEVFQGKNGSCGGVAVRMLCGWMSFVVSGQLKKDNPTCPQCAELFKALMILTP